MSQSFTKKLIGVLGGILVMAYFASMQMLFFIGDIQPKYYLIPILVGAVAGYILGALVAKNNTLKQELERTHSQLRQLYNDSASGSWKWDLKNNQFIFDEHWASILGYDSEEIAAHGKSWKSLIHPDDIDPCYAAIDNHLKGLTDTYKHIHRMQHKKGHWLYVLDQGKVTERNRRNRPLVFSGTQTDITERKLLELKLAESDQKLAKLNLTDSLTGLKNRKAMQAYLKHVWAYYQRYEISFSVLMIDIDDFQAFNQTYGAMKAEACLCQIAEKIAAGARRTNDIAVRFGTQQFVIILSGINAQNTNRLATEIGASIEAMAIEHKTALNRDRVTVSIGTANCSHQQSCKSPKEALKLADYALSKAKQSGGNRVVAIDSLIKT